jgi:alpha-beta hydrolase superfamily lysophospholipase
VIARAATLADQGLPRVLFGHSNGGLITLRALCDEAPPNVRAAVLSSPFLALRTPLSLGRRILAQVANVVWPWLARPSGLAIEDLTTDAGVQADRRADALCFRVATARWFVTTQHAQREVMALAHRIACPTLWLLGSADPIADPACTRRVAGLVPGAEVAEFEGMRHEVCNEVARAAVFDRIGEFLRRVQP